jgi:hypothetical protein
VLAAGPGCAGDDDGDNADARVATAVDAAPPDAGAIDAAIDAGPAADASLPDAAPPDAAPPDAAPPDAAPPDAAPIDAGPAPDAMPPAAPKINEFVFNHTGTDTHEYIELRGAAATDYSTLTVLEIEGDIASGAGVIDGVFARGTTDAAGLFVTAFIPGDIENGTGSILLVQGFTGALGDDLDTDDNGVLDVMPFTALGDAIAVTDGGAGDLTYGGVTLDAAFDGGVFTPGGASRIPDGADTDLPADWKRNDFDGDGLPGFVGTPDPGEAKNTPGLPNQIVAS